MQKTQLALFPLQIFLLPGETTQLHIFEDRYRQLLDDCENVQISFGIPYTQNGYLTGFGCIVELKQVLRRHANGSSDIEIEATGLFKMDRFFMRLGSKLYPGGDVRLIDHHEWPSVSTELVEALQSYLEEEKGLITPELFSANLSVLDVAKMLKLSDEDNLKILKAKSSERRELLLLQNIKFLRLLSQQKNSIRRDVFLN